MILITSSMLGIVGGLLYDASKQVIEQMRYQRSELEAMKREIVSLRKSNDSLIRELIRVQAINQLYDSDAKFIEAETLGEYDTILGVGGE